MRPELLLKNSDAVDQALQSVKKYWNSMVLQGHSLVASKLRKNE